MKIRVTMKDPDAIWTASKEAADESTQGLVGLSEEEIEVLTESRCEKFQNDLSKVFRFGEYLTVEVDTDTGVATVVKEE